MKTFILYLVLVNSQGHNEHRMMDTVYGTMSECTTAGRLYVARELSVRGYLCQGPKVEAEYHPKNSTN